MESRRSLLGLGVLAALAFGHPGSGRAQPLRVLGGDDAGHRPVPPGPAAETLRRSLASVRQGAMARHDGLSVVWLHEDRPAAAALDVLTLEEARGRGDLSIAERPEASVPDLVVDNRGPSCVLLLGGEILIGGKQHRVVREDILLPPRSGPRHIGVYCIEQGRWAGARRDFDSTAAVAAPRLRAQLMQRPGQARVWNEVARAGREAHAPSPTGSYQAIYEQPEVRDHLGKAEAALAAHVPPGSVGAAVFLGARLLGLDVFQPGDLFARQWSKLLRAHAVEAHRHAERPEVAEATLRLRLKEVFARAGAAGPAAHVNAGAGQVLEWAQDGMRGAALVFEARTVHAAIL
jgi:hypothetical protein